jgi:hypothetical protein
MAEQQQQQLSGAVAAQLKRHPTAMILQAGGCWELLTCHTVFENFSNVRQAVQQRSELVSVDMKHSTNFQSSAVHGSSVLPGLL